MIAVLSGVIGVLLFLVLALIWWNWKLVERFTNPPRSYLEEQLAKMGRKGMTRDAEVVAEGAERLARSTVDDADRGDYEIVDPTV